MDSIECVKTSHGIFISLNEIILALYKQKDLVSKLGTLDSKGAIIVYQNLIKDLEKLNETWW
jgi:hypothetical protein